LLLPKGELVVEFRVLREAKDITERLKEDLLEALTDVIVNEDGALNACEAESE